MPRVSAAVHAVVRLLHDAPAGEKLLHPVGRGVLQLHLQHGEGEVDALAARQRRVGVQAAAPGVGAGPGRVPLVHHAQLRVQRHAHCVGGGELEGGAEVDGAQRGLQAAARDFVGHLGGERARACHVRLAGAAGLQLRQLRLHVQLAAQQRRHVAPLQPEAAARKQSVSAGAGAARSTTAHRSFTLRSVVHDSWCVLRSTNSSASPLASPGTSP